MTEPTWLTEAKKHIGVTEITGPKTNAVIASWLHRLKAWWNDDETPWCGVFVAACMQVCGFTLPANWMRARAWADWGTRISHPALGCIVVFERQGGGHVGFVVGIAPDGRLMVLGGNQRNRVWVDAFERSRVLAYIWPIGTPDISMYSLPVLAASGASSSNEA